MIKNEYSARWWKDYHTYKTAVFRIGSNHPQTFKTYHETGEKRVCFFKNKRYVAFSKHVCGTSDTCFENQNQDDLFKMFMLPIIQITQKIQMTQTMKIDFRVLI